MRRLAALLVVIALALALWWAWALGCEAPVEEPEIAIIRE